MKLSFNWLKDFVKIQRSVSPQRLGELLTLHTVEIDGMEKIKGDAIFEVDNKSITHRPDLWGIYGMAREVAAITGNKMKEIKSLPLKVEDDKININVVTKNKDDCLRYVSVALGNIKIGPSPRWLSQRLELSGIRSINNVVDATNYVMMELGQPLHAFDLDKLHNGNSNNEKKIIVRRAKKGETITTLDGVKRELDKETLIIADAKNPIALAGIMGGAKAEIKNNTTNIILEAATFEAVNIRKTSNRLGLRTDASARFEKNLDPHLALTATKRVCELIKQLIPGAIIISRLVDKKNSPKTATDKRVLELPFKEIRKKISVDIKKIKVVKILSSLGFGVKGKDPLIVTVPSWRAGRDIIIPEDLIEEISRIYGYDNILPALPNMPIKPPLENMERKLERLVKNILVDGLGFSEVYNYSFVNEKQLDRLGIKSDAHIKVKNPVSKNATLMRRSLVPNLIKNAKDNQRYFDDFRIFEIGSIYMGELTGDKMRPHNKSMLPKQDKILAGIYAQENDKAPFYAIKQAVETLLKKLNIVYNYNIEIDKNLPYIHQNRFVKIMVNNEELGYISELNPILGGELGIKARMGLFELNFSQLSLIGKRDCFYNKLPKFPAVKLDLSILVDNKVSWKDIEKLIRHVRPSVIKHVELFDLYEGKGLPAGKKSLAFHIKYQSGEKTLTDKEVMEAREEVIGKLKEIGGEVRFK